MRFLRKYTKGNSTTRSYFTVTLFFFKIIFHIYPLFMARHYLLFFFWNKSIEIYYYKHLGGATHVQNLQLIHHEIKMVKIIHNHCRTTHQRKLQGSKLSIFQNIKTFTIIYSSKSSTIPLLPYRPKDGEWDNFSYLLYVQSTKGTRQIWFWRPVIRQNEEAHNYIIWCKHGAWIIKCWYAHKTTNINQFHKTSTLKKLLEIFIFNLGFKCSGTDISLSCNNNKHKVQMLVPNPVVQHSSHR